MLGHHVGSGRRYESNYYVQESASQKYIKSCKILTAYTFSHPRAVMVKALNTHIAVSTMLSLSVSQQSADVTKSMHLLHLVGHFPSSVGDTWL